MPENEHDENESAHDPAGNEAPGKRRVWQRLKVRKKRGKGTSERKKTSLERLLLRVPFSVLIPLGILLFPAGFAVGIWALFDCEDERAILRAWIFIVLAVLIMGGFVVLYFASLPPSPPQVPVEAPN